MKLAQAGGLQAEALPVRDAADIADTILETASERDAAAIVIGSRGLKGLKSKMMGSSSSSVLSRSDGACRDRARARGAQALISALAVAHRSSGWVRFG